MFIYAADIHLTDKQPINRNTPVYPACVDKFRKILEYGKQYAAPVILGGDLFENPCPSYELFNRVLSALGTVPVDVYAIYGNHDVQYGQISGQNNALSALVQTGRIKLLGSEGIVIGKNVVYGVSYRKELYTDFSFLNIRDPKNAVVVTHQFMSDKKLPFNHVEVKDFKTDVKLVLCAHLHDPFSARNASGTVFLNPGCITRLNRNEAYIDPKCVLVTGTGIKYLPLGFPKAEFNESEVKKASFVKSVDEAKVEVQDIEQYIQESNADEKVKELALKLIKEAQDAY